MTELSLNFAVFADFLRTEETASAVDHAMRWGLLKADRLFQVERLHSFNRKFFPHWRRRYFCFERWTDFPLAGLAYLHAESLLTPPGPWVKSSTTWPRDEKALATRCSSLVAAVLVGGASARDSLGPVRLRAARPLLGAGLRDVRRPSEPGNLYVVEQAGRITRR